jgi:hypothetical protein
MSSAYGSSSNQNAFIVLRTVVLHSLYAMNKPSHDYWGLGLCPSSGIIKKHKKHNVSDTGSVSVLR